MQTNQLRLAERIQAAVSSYVEGISVPPYCQAAIQSRRWPERTLPSIWRYLSAGVAAGVILFAGLAFAPAVVAQAERIMQAFMVVNGHSTQVPVNTVSLEQVRADMPFTVVAPAEIPAGLQETVNEVAPRSAYAQAVFQYTRNGGFPTLTIIENSAAIERYGQMVGLRMTYSANGSLPPQPPPLSASPTLPTGWLAHANGGTFVRIQVQPIVWSVRGTRISLISPPGALTTARIAAIVRAMR
jgi:hypothetical protein